MLVSAIGEIYAPIQSIRQISRATAVGCAEQVKKRMLHNIQHVIATEEVMSAKRDARFVPSFDPPPSFP